MIIAIPVEDKLIDSNVCQSFGRAPYFLIYNTETNKSDYVENNASVTQGGAGIKAAQTIVDYNASAILTPRCGKNALEVLQAGKVKIYKTVSGSIKHNINLLKNGKLSLLEEVHAGFHQHGGR